MVALNRIAQFGLNLFGGKNRLYTVGKNSTKTIKWIGEHISSPENRLILGASALLSQPFIDASNKNVDKETRNYSVARTIAKIIVGTTTGFIIRKGCIKLIDAFTILPKNIKPDMKFKNLRQILLPMIKKINATDLQQYKNALGTLVALGVMTFTNFLIDAPLTKLLTNKFIAKQKEADNGKH